MTHIRLPPFSKALKTGTKSVRPTIRERDGGCIVCGTTDRLVIHHIDENPQNNDLMNLVTLCASHHMTHHKSSTTPYPWFATYAATATASMT